ncbi:unnamed protein product [Ambrosiozyma monospora]|uniref:Unnamed protein product n=1 Tax=Ambrosiozyma monospora TaxID=43982 RepID=A0ACB5SYR7_AMBMO|nr:unnamed protein product [Ambrosiozyma monospora]
MPFSDQFQDLGLIGRGSFGCVRKVLRKSDQKIYVRKEISYLSMSMKEIRQLASEFKILRELQHPNIVEYLGHEDIEKDSMLHIYMEYCDGGDLSKLIKKYKEKDEFIPENLIWEIFTQVLLALYKCHNGVDIERVENLFNSTPDVQPSKVDNLYVVIHRDIKPDNIFLLSDGYSIKLGDFGLAKCLRHEDDFAKTCVGTPYYMPPEVIMDKPYDPVCDIWSLGCVMYELCSLRPPFMAKTHLTLQEKIKAGSFNDIPPHYSHRMRMCISACLIVDPNERASANQLLQDVSFKFFRKDWELKQQEAMLKRKEIELVNFEKRLSKYEKGLDESLKLMTSRNEETKLRYKREFNFLLEMQLNKILGDLPSNIKTQLIHKVNMKENQHPYISQLPEKTNKLKGPRELNGTRGIVRSPSRR